MQKIKPAEVSALLKKQLESADIQSSFDEIGTVLEVGDGIVRGLWSNKCPIWRACCF